MKTMEVFKTIIEGQEFEIGIKPNGWGWLAVTSDYDGSEDKINIAHSMKSSEDALLQLVEQLEENILSK